VYEIRRSKNQKDRQMQAFKAQNDETNKLSDKKLIIRQMDEQTEGSSLDR